MTYTKELLVKELEEDEGRRDRAYFDSLGIPTIGVGWNLEANSLPQDIIDELLDISIGHATAGLDILIPRWRELDDDRQRVLINMAFNMGPIRLAGFKNFVNAIKEFIDSGIPGYLDKAANEMLDSKWAKQVGKRAERLATRMRQGGTP